MSQTILLTGAAGFIGSNVAQLLLRRGDRVVGVDNFDPYYDRSRKELNLQAVRAAAGAERFDLVEADITRPEAMDGLLASRKPDGVIHLAARAGVRPSIAQPVTYAHVNVTGTAVVLEAARQVGCGRVVVASSSSVYGNCPTVPFREDMDVSEPISPYAATKRACELAGYTHWHLTRMPTAMLRFFTVYGPAQRPDLAISMFIEKISKGVAIPMYGNGHTSRDYTYIDDIAAGVVAAYDRIDRFGYRVWNLGNSSPVTLMEMIATIERAVGKKAVIQEHPDRPGDVERTFADLTRSGAELGYRPTVRFEEGVTRQVAWARTNLGIP